MAWEQAGPQRTVDVVMGVLPKDGPTSSKAEAENGVAGRQASMNGQAAAEVTEQGNQEQVETANTAAEVADSAEKIDKHVELGPSA